MTSETEILLTNRELVIIGLYLFTFISFLWFEINTEMGIYIWVADLAILWAITKFAFSPR